MAQKEIGSIIVTKDGRPYGIVTERDIIRRLAADLSMFLSPSRRPGIISSVLQAIARGRKRHE